MIIDSGATGHYINTQQPCSDCQQSINPIQVQLPHGKSIVSTHTANLNLPGVPAAANKAHIFPSLGQHSLISLGVLCDNEYEATFDKHKVTITRQGHPLFTGKRTSNGLWTLNKTNNNQEQKMAMSVINTQSSTIRDLMHFLYAACFSPPSLRC